MKQNKRTHNARATCEFSRNFHATCELSYAMCVRVCKCGCCATPRSTRAFACACFLWTHTLRKLRCFFGKPLLASRSRSLHQERCKLLHFRLWLNPNDSKGSLLASVQVALRLRAIVVYGSMEVKFVPTGCGLRSVFPHSAFLAIAIVPHVLHWFVLLFMPFLADVD